MSVVCRAAALSLAAVISVACRAACATETAPAPGTLVRAVTSSTPSAAQSVRFIPAWKLDGTPAWAHIYIDASGSMKGFLGRKDQWYERLLSRIPDIAIGTSAVQLEVFSFGSQVSPPIIDRPLQRFVADPRIYAELNTYLPAPLEHSIVGEGRGLTIVVTDGVASSARKSKNSCGLLSDTACLARRVHDYVNKGYGFWIVGARLPFVGLYFVEEGGGAAPVGTKLNVSVEGRPLYVWIATPNARQGRRIASDLVDFLSTSGKSVLALEVAPGEWSHWRLPDALSARDIQNNPKRDAKLSPSDVCKAKSGLWRSFTGARGSGQGATVEFPPDSANASLSVRLPIEKLTESPDSAGHLLPLLRFAQALGLELPPGVASDLAQLRSSFSGNEGTRASIDLCLEVKSPGSVEGKELKVLAEWAGPKTPDIAPWRDWSTDIDDTAGAADRTVNLSRFIDHLLRAFTEQDPSVVWQEPFLAVKYQK